VTRGGAVFVGHCLARALRDAGVGLGSGAGASCAPFNSRSSHQAFRVSHRLRASRRVWPDGGVDDTVHQDQPATFLTPPRRRSQVGSVGTAAGGSAADRIGQLCLPVVLPR
jgi:hypothetical protein